MFGNRISDLFSFTLAFLSCGFQKDFQGFGGLFSVQFSQSVVQGAVGEEALKDYLTLFEIYYKRLKVENIYINQGLGHFIF